MSAEYVWEIIFRVLARRMGQIAVTHPPTEVVPHLYLLECRHGNISCGLASGLEFALHKLT